MLDQQDRSDSYKSIQPDKVTPRHRALMRRLVAGITLSQAAEDLGFTVSRASVIVNSPLFQEQMAMMEKELNTQFAEAEAGRSANPVRTELEQMALTAAKTLRGALDDSSVSARISAAKDILDRTGYAKEDKLKAQVTVEPSQGLIDTLKRMSSELVKSKIEEPTND